MGFYRNYSSKSDLLEKFIQQCFDETIEELNEAGVKVLSITKTIEITLKYFQQYKSYMETLIKRDILYLLWKIYDKCFTEFFNINDATRFKTYSIKMFIGELFSLETEWVKSGMKESPEKLSRIFYRVLSQRVSLN